MVKKTNERGGAGAGLLFGAPPPPKWHASLREAITDLSTAVLTVAVAAGVTVAIVLLLIKLATYVFG